MICKPLHMCWHMRVKLIVNFPQNKPPTVTDIRAIQTFNNAFNAGGLFDCSKVWKSGVLHYKYVKRGRVLTRRIHAH